MTPLLEVKNLVKYFPVHRGFFKRSREYIHAVDDITFSLNRSETLGLVGESGCGKSTAGRTILSLIEPTGGRVFFQGRNVFELGNREKNHLRRHMQMIFQDPFGSLNPRLTVERIVEEPLITHRMGATCERRRKVQETLKIVGLLPEHMKRFPHEFSGGQRQRIMIARALILGPSLIIGDEPVSALDVSVQAQILNLMVRLQRQFGFSYVIISHDLGVIRYISHRVAVMYLGEIVELAKTDELYKNPLHPYTIALLSAVPIPDPRRHKQRIILQGDVPSPLNPPSGCRFHPRCPYRLDICDTKKPVTHDRGMGHAVSCHYYAEGETRRLPSIPPATGDERQCG
ncbi:MAG: dipeptide ABC transporter ATP-binding protein [Deltaproteobacteria bacterium]|nr:dipeptide ABC transporter ATP-binding protein [Deltaproteobacteria bacterium]